MGTLKNSNLTIAVFFCGACVMVVEIVGSRILAPFFGTTTVVWSTLIGTILASLSLGYWYGGIRADRNGSLSGLSLVIFGAALCTAGVAFLNPFVLALGTKLGLAPGALVSTAILFGPLTFLLGMVTPYAVKLRMDSLNTSAQTVGNLAAISTFGSIAGTFLAGFCLLPLLGCNNILLSVSLTLIGTSLLVFAGNRLAGRSLAAVLVALVLFPNLILANTLEKYGFLDFDTAYNRVIFTKSVDKATNRPLLYLLTGPREFQSAIYLDNPEEPYSKYVLTFRVDKHFNPNIKRALLIGGAGFSYARDFLRRFPEAQLDVVEIDKQMTELAKKYFHLDENPRLKIFYQDGRTFLRENQTKYDAIIVDAFSSSGDIPFQLTTSEAVREIHRSLTDQGIMMMNMISAFEGNGSKMFRAEYTTYKQFFPQIFTFAMEMREPSLRQNIAIIALKSTNIPSLKSEDQDAAKVLSRRYTTTVAEDLPVLTDDYAPVEYYHSE